MTDPSTLKRIVFWAPEISEHFHSLLIALAATGLEVVACVQKRRMLPLTDAEGFSLCVRPNRSAIHRLVHKAPRTTLHVFCRIARFSMLGKGLGSVRRAGVPFALYGEPCLDTGWKSSARALLKKWTERSIRRKAAFVLAVGRQGPAWFERLGHAPERIHPFAYFPSSPAASEIPVIDQSVLSRDLAAPAHVGFAGKLEAGWGVHDLMKAMVELRNTATLTMVGSGAAREKMLRGLEENGIPGTVLEPLPAVAMHEQLRQWDVLVLPLTAPASQEGGWETVVSESLMRGCAVITSDHTGASLALSNQPNNGRIIPANSPHAIAQAVRQLQQDKMYSPTARLERSRWAREHLSATAGARYLLAIAAHHLSAAARPAYFGSA